jgi:hypothetical protein
MKAQKIEDIINQMNSGIQLNPEDMAKRADTFIDRCLSEKEYTLQTLGQEIFNCLNTRVWLQIGMPEALPHVLERIEERMQEGE